MLNVRGEIRKFQYDSSAAPYENSEGCLANFIIKSPYYQLSYILLVPTFIEVKLGISRHKSKLKSLG